MYSVHTSVWGNPDHGQDPSVAPWGVENTVLTADDLDMLQITVDRWQVENDIGGGNWDNAKVYYNEHYLGSMSYNGKINPEGESNA